MHVVLRWIQVAWVAVLMVACAPASTAPETAAPTAQTISISSSPSATMVPTTEVPATETPTVSATLLPSVNPTITNTPVPSATATPSPTASRTPTPTNTATATQTVAPTATASAMKTPEFLATSVSQSPDGQWLAESSLSYVVEQSQVQGYDTRLRVSRVDGSVAWTFVDYVQGAGLGFAIPEIHRWSADGEHAYFTNRVVPDGCAWFVNGSDLHRADLTSGEVTEIMPSLARALSLSPDEATVAYFPWGPSPDLYLRDLASGQERNLAWQIPFDNPGNIVWSPGGDGLALTLSAGTCSPDRTHSLVRVDASTLATTLLVDRDDRLFTIVSWLHPEQLSLKDKDGRSWWLNAQTREITETE